MTQQEIDKAVNDWTDGFGGSTVEIAQRKKDVAAISYRAGATMVNERQPYTKDDIISSINWLVENRFVICYDNKRWWWEKELDKTQKEYSTDDLFKLWEETRNG